MNKGTKFNSKASPRQLTPALPHSNFRRAAIRDSSSSTEASFPKRSAIHVREETPAPVKKSTGAAKSNAVLPTRLAEVDTPQAVRALLQKADGRPIVMVGSDYFSILPRGSEVGIKWRVDRLKAFQHFYKVCGLHFENRHPEKLLDGLWQFFLKKEAKASPVSETVVESSALPKPNCRVRLTEGSGVVEYDLLPNSPSEHLRLPVPLGSDKSEQTIKSPAIAKAFRDAEQRKAHARATRVPRNPRDKSAAPVVALPAQVPAVAETKKQAELPQLFHDGFPYIAGSVVQQYLLENGPKGSNAIKLKRMVVDSEGKISSLEVYRKGSKTKTKLLSLEAVSWEGTRLAAHLKKENQNFDVFVGKLQKQVDMAFERNEKLMRPLPSFSKKKERDLALNTLSKVMKALDRLKPDDFILEFLRSKPQSVPRVALHVEESRDLYDKGDLTKLQTLKGQDLRHFIDDMVSLALESMFKSRVGKFSVKDVEAFVTSFRTLGEPLEDITAKSNSRVFQDVMPDKALVEKFFADQDAQDFVRAIDQLFKKVSRISPVPEHKNDLCLTFTLLPFILGGMTADELAMAKIVEWKPLPFVGEMQFTRISIVYGECSKAWVGKVMRNPESFFPK